MKQKSVFFSANNPYILHSTVERTTIYIYISK